MSDSLRALNAKAYNLAAEFMAHPAYRCLPGYYIDAVENLFDATQEVHTTHEDRLDFGDEDGTGGTEARASSIAPGDVVLEEGDFDAYIVTVVATHGDSILLTGQSDGMEVERTLDMDETVTYWRGD